MIKYLLAFLLFSSPCLAGMGLGGFPYPGPGVVSFSPEESTCMAGVYTIAWNGSESTGTNYACDSSGTPVSGSINGSPEIGTTFGEGGEDVAIKVDALNETLSWTDSGGLKVDPAGAQTVWLRVYLSAAPTSTGEILVWEAYSDTTNYLQVFLTYERKVRVYYRSGATTKTTWSTGVIAEDTWTDIAFSWDYSGGDYAANALSAWREILNDMPASPATVPAAIRIITRVSFPMDVGEFFSVTQYAVVNGYKAAKPW